MEALPVFIHKGPWQALLLLLLLLGITRLPRQRRRTAPSALTKWQRKSSGSTITMSIQACHQKPCPIVDHLIIRKISMSASRRALMPRSKPSPLQRQKFPSPVYLSILLYSSALQTFLIFLLGGVLLSFVFFICIIFITGLTILGRHICFQKFGRHSAVYHHILLLSRFVFLISHG